MRKYLPLIILLLSLVTGSKTLKAQEILREGKRSVSTYWLDGSAVMAYPIVRLGEYYDEELDILVPRDTIISTGAGSRRADIIDIDIMQVNGIPDGLTAKYEVQNDITKEYFTIKLRLFGKLKKRLNTNLVVRFSYEALIGDQVIRRSRTISNISVYTTNTFRISDVYYSGREIYNLRASPNPMEDLSTISFNVTTNSTVTVEIHDVLGKKVYTKIMQAIKGYNESLFMKSSLPAGLYIYTVKTANDSASKRLLIN